MDLFLRTTWWDRNHYFLLRMRKRDQRLKVRVRTHTPSPWAPGQYVHHCTTQPPMCMGLNRTFVAIADTEWLSCPFSPLLSIMSMYSFHNMSLQNTGCPKKSFFWGASKVQTYVISSRYHLSRTSSHFASGYSTPALPEHASYFPTRACSQVVLSDQTRGS